MEAKISQISLITIYDNYQADPKLEIGWGFSCLLKIKDKNILFDTGAESLTLLSNMEKMGITPQEIDLIVLSHIHGDHTGGLEGILKKNGEVTVFIPASFPDSMKKMIENYGAKYQDIKTTEKISEGVWSTGELGTWIKEQSLVVTLEKGLIVITGCAHPGIIHIIEKAK
jgi:7,8-dihydropterin-6-yl-methyl-4-(beta-D-ribofuranosyl)aminobenzene 5'-phosphate synthase